MVKLVGNVQLFGYAALFCPLGNLLSAAGAFSLHFFFALFFTSCATVNKKEQNLRCRICRKIWFYSAGESCALGVAQRTRCAVSRLEVAWVVNLETAWYFPVSILPHSVCQRGHPLNALIFAYWQWGRGSIGTGEYQDGWILLNTPLSGYFPVLYVIRDTPSMR